MLTASGSEGWGPGTPGPGETQAPARPLGARTLLPLPPVLTDEATHTGRATGLLSPPTLVLTPARTPADTPRHAAQPSVRPV